MNLLQVFNEKFIEMLKDLSKVFSADPEFKLYLASARMILLTDENAIREVFHDEVVVPFEKHILDRDEAFFLTKDYKEYAGQMGSAGADANRVITKLKTCWTSLNEENQDVVWKYLHLLVLLDKKMKM